MTEQSKEYYARRSEEERLAADRAPDERAARSHRELAGHYRERAAGKPLPDDSAEPNSGTISKEFRVVP